MNTTNKELMLPENCTTLVQYGDYVLAKREFEVLAKPRVEYITWSIDNDGSVSLGHYFGDDLPAAQEDFAKRSELVSEAKLFNADEYAVLYRALSEYEYSGAINDDEPKLWQHVENIRFKLDRIPDVDVEKNSRIKALIVEPDGRLFEETIVCEPLMHCDIVSGYTRISYPFKDSVVVLSNDKREKSGLPFNQEICGEPFYGNIILANMNDNIKLYSLSPEQIKEYTEMFESAISLDKFERTVDRAFESMNEQAALKNDLAR